MKTARANQTSLLKPFRKAKYPPSSLPGNLTKNLFLLKTNCKQHLESFLDILSNFKNWRKIWNLSPLTVGIETTHCNINLIPLNHSNLMTAWIKSKELKKSRSIVKVILQYTSLNIEKLRFYKEKNTIRGK